MSKLIDTYYVYRIIDGTEDQCWPRMGPYRSSRQAWIDARAYGRDLYHQGKLCEARGEGYVVAWCREEATDELLSRLY